MLKEIKKESDVITNQDLFHEIIEKVKESEKWPSNLVDYEQADNYDNLYQTDLCGWVYSLCSQAAMKGIILIFISEVIIV